jgi:hypothetical protein
MWRQGRLQLDTSLFLCRSTALLPLNDERGLLAPHPTLLASAPLSLVLAEARAPALLAFAPFALVRAEARAPALLAFAPLALMRALRALLLGRSYALLVVFDPIALIAARLFLLGGTVAQLRRHPSITPLLLPLCRPAALLRLDWRWSAYPPLHRPFPQVSGFSCLPAPARVCDCLKVLLGGADGVSQSPT